MTKSAAYKGSQYHFPFDRASSHSSYFWLLQFSARARYALEVGCATGFFSQHLVDQGTDVTGVEIDTIMAEQARSVCSRVVVGNIELSSVQAQIEGQFDLVLLADVLEHLQQPQALLEKILRDWLVPGGRVVISIPNAAHWIFRREVLCGRFPYRQYGLFDQTHLRFFTRTSLSHLIRESGYQVEREAITINSNDRDDLTFAAFAPLYRQPHLYRIMVRLECYLACLLPRLFAYQFVMSLYPCLAV